MEAPIRMPPQVCCLRHLLHDLLNGRKPSVAVGTRCPVATLEADILILYERQTHKSVLLNAVMPWQVWFEAASAPCVRAVVRCSVFPLFLRWAGSDDDLRYLPERKAGLLKRLLPPSNIAIWQLSQDEGISEVTLHKWRAEARGKGQHLPAADAGPEGWSSRDKVAVVLETAALNQADLAEYCRKRGLYPALITAWRSACEQANDCDRASTARLGHATKEEGKLVKDLKREPKSPAHMPNFDLADRKI